MISGTNGLLGAADGAFIMQKKRRTRLLSAAITVLLTAVIAAWTVMNGRTL